jgi:hypothetical protein
MIKYVEVKALKPEKLICDCCKTTYDVDVDVMEVQEFHHVDFVGGFDSIFGDGVEVRCDICQYCLKKMLDGYWRVEGDKEIGRGESVDEGNPELKESSGKPLSCIGVEDGGVGKYDGRD